MKKIMLSSLLLIATLNACNTQGEKTDDEHPTESMSEADMSGNENIEAMEIFATTDVQVIDSLRSLYSSHGVSIDSMIQLHDTQYLKASVKEEIRTMLSAP